MRPHSRASRVALRRAVLASVAAHVAAALVVVAVARLCDHAPPRAPVIDTRAGTEPDVRMHLVEEAAAVVEPPAPKLVTPPKTTPDTAANDKGPEPTPAPPAPLHAGPFAPAPPRTLPPELTTLLRKPAAPAVEVPARAAPGGPQVDPNVRPAANASPAPIHGAMKPGRTVVYVLDCSGSMGGAGKFDAARAALAATLRQQPATVRFQVIVYDGRARPLLASDGHALPATEGNVRAAAERLAELEPRGKSNHLDAVRVALAFRPDVILMLTDADDLTAAALRPVLAAAPKPAPVRVGQVTAGGVEQPRELR
jgi:hypothetical protein